MIVKDKQWILTVTVTAKSMIVLFMTVVILFRYEAETVCRVIWMEDITDRKMTKKEIKARCE
jgi:hypothetical protein